MQVNNPSGDGVVSDLITVIDKDEEEIKPAHDGRGHVDVLLQTLASVISTSVGIGCS